MPRINDRRTDRWRASVAASALALSLLAWLPAPSTGALSTLPAAAEAASASIVSSDLEAHVRYLASDELQGRGLGQPGNELATRYVADAVQGLGLNPASGTSFYQGFDLDVRRVAGTSTLEVVEAPGAGPERISVTDGFLPFHSSASSTATGGLAFAGYGITAASLSYDDYAGLDVRGRIVVVLDHEPQEHDEDSRFDGRQPTPYASIRRKAVTAAGHGAAGLIVVPDVANHEPAGDGGEIPDQGWPASLPGRFALASETRAHPLPVAFVPAALGERLISPAGGSSVRIADLQHRIDAALARVDASVEVSSPASFQVPGRQAGMTVTIERAAVRAAHNVLGLLEGADPVLRDELVIVGAHLDHDGVDELGRIFNGADDNASGVAAALAVAGAMTRAVAAGERPRRSILFAFWNGEEKGLYGSRHYVRAPLPQGARIVAKLNLDMVGRSEDVPASGDPRLAGFEPTTAAENANVLHLIGASYSPDLARPLEQESAALGLTIRTDYDNHPSNLLRRSDHWPFLERGIPALFVTTGLHPDYHTPADTSDKLDFAKLERISRLVFRAAWRLADQDERPEYVSR